MVYTGEAKKELRALLDESGRELISRTEETRQKEKSSMICVDDTKTHFIFIAP